MISFTSRPTSESATWVFGDDDDDGVRGGRPDLESSPEVLIWIKILRGVVRSFGSALSSALAALAEVRVWIVSRFGIACYRVSGNESYEGLVFNECQTAPASVLALLDCNVPMKCQRISRGNYKKSEEPTIHFFFF